ncbi:MAG TPA: metallophosphoesterase [Acidobacteriota bacterium]|nr:metallophosphoesterase [Acidobacteriota bacterium]
MFGCFFLVGFLMLKVVPPVDLHPGPETDRDSPGSKVSIVAQTSTVERTQVSDSATDGWRLEIGPPGNEFYEAPPVPEAPSAKLFELVRKIAPAHTQIKRWEWQRRSRYFIRAEADSEEYDFLLSPEGRLLQIYYENDQTNVLEQPGKMVLKGTKKEISVSEVPVSARETLQAAFPGQETTGAWMIDSPAGRRFVIALDGLAFFSRPDGQIQAAGPVGSALDEIDVKDLTPPKPEEIIAEAVRRLGPYNSKFDFQKQISRLPRPGSSFRFVAMGDSRSNPEMWSLIVKQINSLDPKPAFIISTGDIVSRGYTQEYLDYFLPPLEKTDIPFFVAIGNHDDGDSGQALEYRTLFGEESLNYFFDYGKWRFIAIDNSSSVHSASETLAWLEKTLSNTPEGYSVVVYAHKPISNIEKWAYHSWEPEPSARFADMVTRHQVKHVFFGHIHAYSTASLNGIPYTITGGGGAGLHDRYGPQGNVHHFVVCDVAPDGTLNQQVFRYRKAERTD